MHLLQDQHLNKILVTGGAGFVGSALITHLILKSEHQVVNVDKLTYAASLKSLELVESSDRYAFERVDINDACSITEVLLRHRPDAVVHLAAESHVDKSIGMPYDFVSTNILGTFTLLEATRHYLTTIDDVRKQKFRFLHVSTDEVYGDLGVRAKPIRERMAYDPSSPYSASKAASDHLARAWHRTYNLPVIITHSSNNFGPRQFSEKLIPLMIKRGLEGRALCLYGDGNQVRDWLFVEDHARALFRLIREGTVGDTYNIGGGNEKRNIDVIKMVCALLNELHPSCHEGISRYEDLITFVSDRPGHDYRYALDCSKIKRELGWVPRESFASGLRKTVEWYLHEMSDLGRL